MGTKGRAHHAPVEPLHQPCDLLLLLSVILPVPALPWPWRRSLFVVVVVVLIFLLLLFSIIVIIISVVVVVSISCIFVILGSEVPRTPRRGTGAGSSEPDPAESGGLVFGRFGPGLVSAPLVPVLPPVGIDVPQEGAGFAEDFGVCAWVVFLDLKEGQKQGPE